MNNLKTTIGLEIHVQLKTKSKMFCRCDNFAEDKAPNTVVCPVCLGLPGALPVANRQAIEWTIKTGLALNCNIPKIAKFDRKHYFYPDLPKGYQISQYDEPFAIKGSLKLKSQNANLKIEEERTIRLNRIHLEEDAGKLIHSNGKSLVDLNRAGTPLMEMVTEPDITSPKEAGDFVRRLQKLVRDEVKVSDADMEKGHLRCDANISISDEEGHMSKIVEIKNLNSFRFIEKALTIEEEKLKAEYPNWPTKKTKATHGYDSKTNTTYVQREKEEAADYRYFPEPDLPPFDTTEFDIESLKQEIGESLEARLKKLEERGIAPAEAKVLLENKEKDNLFDGMSGYVESDQIALLAKAIVHNYFPFSATSENKYPDYAKAITALSEQKISKAQFSEIASLIHQKDFSYDSALEAVGGGQTDNGSEMETIIDKIIAENPNEVAAYNSGRKQLFGFFMGQVMKATAGRVNPQIATKILKEKLGD